MIKRLFDIAASLALGILFLPFVLGVVLWMLIKKDLPFLYVSERMKTVDQHFQLYKFRTMTPPRSSDQNTGVSGGDKSDRITPLGNVLRKYRLDEIPQLINILRGDMSFVGPRPPLRRYTESHRALYQKVLRSKPGLTGLASFVFHKREEALLSKARSSAETEEIYMRRCIPWKAHIDLVYQRNANFCFDIWIIWMTFLRVFAAKFRNRG